uniref:Phosphoribosyltransferase domain-containing protein n=1 Tax=Micrurus lemniscatus lemniscatus TaxID=129467 RepID=A0A2D4H1I4_MICLE
MEQGLRDCCRSIRIGKILIQSDEETQRAKVYYAKFPPDIYRRKVLLMYPILSECFKGGIGSCVGCRGLGWNRDKPVRTGLACGELQNTPISCFAGMEGLVQRSPDLAALGLGDFDSRNSPASFAG